MDSGTPEALLERWRRQGDGAALGSLFDATAPDLFRIALSVAPDPATAEDALQETFLALIEAAPRVDLSRPLFPFLVGILRHKVEKARARGRRVPDPARLPDPDLRVEDPARAAEAGDEVERVRRAILALPEPYRKAALLRWQHGLEPAEIAEILGKPPGTVWSLLSRAQARLKRALAGAPMLLASGARPPRGLDAVKGEVLRGAAALAAAGTGAAALTLWGGVLVAKKALVAVAVALLLAGGWWWRGRESPPPVAVAPPAPPPPVASAAPPVVLPTAAPPVADVPPSPPPAPTPGPEGERPFPSHVGRVVDGDRRPVAGALVRLPLPGGAVAQARTGPDGGFEIRPPNFRSRGGPIRVNLVATDGKGGIGIVTVRMRFPPSDEEREISLMSLMHEEILLRPVASLSVRVLAGGVPVAGARVSVDSETTLASSEEARTDARGLASFPALFEGPWTVHASAPARGRGRARVSLSRAPAEPVDLSLSSRTVEVEVVAAGSGKPVEGVGLQIREEQFGGKEPLLTPFVDYPLQARPTDSDGRTRIEGVGEEERLELLPVPAGEANPAAGTVPVPVEAGAIRARIEVAAVRRVRWPLQAGGRPVPPEGTEIEVAEAGEFRLRSLIKGKGYPGRIRDGALEAEGFGSRALNLVAFAPDGSMARLRAAAGAERGEPASFSDPVNVEVTVKDEGGRPVTDSIVVLRDETGEALGSMEPPSPEGRTVYEGLPAGIFVVCVLAHSDYGGGEAERIELKEGTVKREIVVGNFVPIGVRIRVGGKPRLPAAMELLLAYPAPTILDDLLIGERPEGAKEDPERGEVTFHARALAPGKSIPIHLKLPRGDPLQGEVRPSADGSVSWVEFDLP